MFLVFACLKRQRFSDMHWNHNIVKQLSWLHNFRFKPRALQLFLKLDSSCRTQNINYRKELTTLNSEITNPSRDPHNNQDKPSEYSAPADQSLARWPRPWAEMPLYRTISDRGIWKKNSRHEVSRQSTSWLPPSDKEHISIFPQDPKPQHFHKPAYIDKEKPVVTYSQVTHKENGGLIAIGFLQQLN